jgi:hypothetical protein
VLEFDEKALPCVRTYKTSLAWLVLTRVVDLEQALTAVAADGVEAATEHIDIGMPAMVVKTVFSSKVTESDRGMERERENINKISIHR